MRRIAAIVVIAAVILCNHYSSSGQNKGNRNSSGHLDIAEAKERPDLCIDYSSVAQFKLASRKLIYRKGEIISIDSAIINMSNTPTFFQSLNNATILVRDDRGTDVSVNEYAIIDSFVTPKSYSLVQPSKITIGRSLWVIGCEEWQVYEEKSSKLDIEDQKSRYVQELFTYHGGGCLNITRPGTYIFTAEIENDFAIVSSGRAKIKTAIGSIRSSPLSITIIE